MPETMFTKREVRFMRRMISLVLTALVATSCIGCAANTPTAPAKEEESREAAAKNAEDTSSEETPPADAAAQEEPAVPDMEAVEKTAALIDAIYVQEWTDTTKEQCAAARAAWDALTKEEKALVEGEDADPDYFGRDTGDASLDDPRNLDEIGENELLVVSFGTSFNDSRANDIKSIEDALQEAYPDWSVRRAFTSQIILNHILARDGESIDNMEQALVRAEENGVKNLIIQPTHLMHGAEYDELEDTLAEHEGSFATVSIAEPLLGKVGKDASEVNTDKETVAKAITQEAVEKAGYKTPEEAAGDGTAFVFMGHGTSHTAKVSYSQMQAQVDSLGYENVFIGTVEGEPEETSCENIIEAVKEAGYTKVVLRPLMVVAGDHANNDMAGEDEDSWRSMFLSDGAFESVDCQIEGLGRIKAIQDLYAAHTLAAMQGAGFEISAVESPSYLPADGTYSAVFNTDSSMFRVNEANEDKGILTVKDGKMTLHVSLISKKILQLYPGKAEDAKNADPSDLLEPTVDTVTYDDGMTEEVYGFDIPVPALEQDFDLAIIGEKGKWYDHVVSVSSPEPVQ